MSEREPITAAIRKSLDASWDPWPAAREGLRHKCDAIDAVHAQLERENAELRQRVAELDNERVNMHDGWVRLPLDADGVPIRVGDEVVDELDELDESTAPRKVTGLYLANDGWWVYIGGIGRRPDRYRHHHAPTVEDVLREFADEMNQNLGMYTGEAIDANEWRDADNKTIAEYAAKLRLAGDAE